MAQDGTRRWGRVWRRIGLIAGAFVLILILGVTLLGPSIAGRIARGVIERQASEAVAGDVRVDRVRLSWLGPQRIGPVTLTDTGGEAVATLELKATTGLLSLIFGSLDLGAVTIAGTVDIVEFPDGTTNLQRAVASTSTNVPAVPDQRTHPPPPSASAPPPPPTPTSASAQPLPRLPRSLAAAIRIDALDVTYTRRGSDARTALRIEIPGLTGSARLAVGEPITAELKARAMYAAGDVSQPKPAGTLSLSASIKHVIAVDGAVTQDRAELEALVEISEASIELADALMGQDGRLVAALGDRARATLRAWGGASEFYADVSANSPSASADAGIRYTDGWLATSRPLIVRALTEGVTGTSPAFKEALHNHGVFVLDAYPSVTLQLEARIHTHNLSGGPGAPVDLRGSSVSASLRVGEFGARAWLAGDQAPPTAYRVEPWELRLDAPDLGGGIRLHGATAATMDGRSAGALDIDLTLHGLLDDLGGIREAGPEGLDGTIALTGVRTAPFEGVFIPFGFDLASDIGQEINARLTASQRRTASTGEPETLLEAFIEASNLRARAEAEFAGGTIRTVGRGVEARVARAGPLLDRMLKDHGVRVAAPVTITAAIRSVNIAWSALTNPDGLDLRGIAGNFAMNIAEAHGTMQLAGTGESQPWRIAPTQIRAVFPGQGRDITASVVTSASLANKPAGQLDVGITVKPGLDAAGVMPGMKPDAIEARVSLTDVAAASLDTFALTPGPLADALGADIDLEVKAIVRPRQVGTTAGLPRVDGEFALGAKGATASGAFRLSQNTLMLSDPLVLHFPDTGVLLAALLDAEGPAAFNPGGETTLSVRDLAVPFSESNAPDLARASGQLSMHTKGVKANTRIEPARSLGVDTFDATLSLAAGASPSLVLEASGRESHRPVRLTADLKAPGLLRYSDGEFGLDLLGGKLVGALNLDAPSGLADFIFPPDSEDPTTAQLAALLRNLLGETVALNMRFAESAAGFTTTVNITAEQVNTAATADITPDRFTLREFNTTATVTTQAFETLLAAFAPELEPRPRLAQPGPVTLSTAAITVPRTELGAPDLAHVQDVIVSLRAPQRLVVQGLRFAPPEGPARPIGPVGVQNLDASIKVPLAAVIGDGEGDAALTLTATMLDEGGAAGTVSARANVALRGGKPAGRATGEFSTTDLRLRVADRLITDPGLISGAVGDTATANATFDLVFDPEPSEEGPAILSGRFTARLSSPRIQIAQPLTIELTPDTARVSAVRGTWKVAPDWANRWLVTDAAKPRPLQLDREAEVQFNLAALTISRGVDVGPLKPGVFRLQLYAKSPNVTIALPEGVIVTLADLDFTAGHTVQGAGVGLDLKLHDQALRGPEPIRVQGVAYGIADEHGFFTAEAMNLTGSVKAAALSTPLIDAILQQEGLLIEALGPRLMLDVQASGVSMTSGRIVAVTESPRAKATVTGDIKPDGLLTIPQSEFTLMEITPKLGSTLFRAIPSIGGIEKRREDTPHARILITGLTYPLDGDMRRLNAGIRFEPGPIRFTTSPLFGGLLKAVHQRDFAVVGRRLDPLTMNITDGVLAYDRYTFPVGEFTFQTQGSVNIAERSIDVVTYVPLGMLTDEAVGRFRTGVGTILGQVPVLSDLTLVPIRASGSLDKTSVNVDARTFVREFGAKLLRPDQLLERGVRQILERIGG